MCHVKQNKICTAGDFFNTFFNNIWQKNIKTLQYIFISFEKKNISSTTKELNYALNTIKSMSSCIRSL